MTYYNIRENIGFPDNYQKEIIETAPEKRMIVDAGPGTGKTAVACARVAWLIDNGGVEPVNIWLVSFTRTAVKEIQDRIKDYLNNPDDVYSVRTATLDSHAWKIHSGFDKKAALTGRYEDNIENLKYKINENKEEADFIRNQIKHLIIDEAQDIVKTRSELILSVINHMDKSAGISVFSDDAQAIYGFNRGKYGQILTDSLKENYGDEFSVKHLKTIHRTESPGLKKIYRDTRTQILNNSDKNKFEAVREDIISYSEKIPYKDKYIFSDESCFYLHRKKAGVLRESGFLKIPHRLRMSGLPVCIYPWVGITLHDYTEKKLKRKDFYELWDERINGKNFGTAKSEDAWNILCRLGGESGTRIIMDVLRQYLGASRPPAEVCYPEFGISGPVLSTIHASKGRESREVRLVLNKNYTEDDEDKKSDDEEARVLFVAATRAREKLLYSEMNQIRTLDVKDSQREFCRTNKKNSLQIQIGIAGDINAESVAGTGHFSSPDDIMQNIRTMAEKCTEMTDAYAWRDAECGHFYRIVPCESKGPKMWEFNSSELKSLRRKSIAVFAGSLNNDIFKAKEKIGAESKSIPPNLNYLRIFGLRTIVLPPGSKMSEKLHEPWSESGIIPAPIISGFPTIYFN
jgi:hypothetical protein